MSGRLAGLDGLLARAGWLADWLDWLGCLLAGSLLALAGGQGTSIGFDYTSSVDACISHVKAEIGWLCQHILSLRII